MPNVKFMMYNYVDFDSLDDEGYVYVSIDVDNIFCAMWLTLLVETSS